MFVGKTTNELIREAWQRGLDPNPWIAGKDPAGQRMALVHELETYETELRRVKTKPLWPTQIALSICVLFRLTDAGFSLYISSTLLNSDTFRFAWVITACLLGSLAQSVVAYIFHSRLETRKHNPYLSALLGLLHLQIVVELIDTVRGGKKTECYKWIMRMAVVFQSLPLTLYFSYIGYFQVWDYDLAAAVWVAMMNLGLTLISEEKITYVQRGLGKLPLFSSYSIVLLLYRSVELPCRVFVLMLFAAEFVWFVFIVFAIDVLFIYLIRTSSQKRSLEKKERSRAALTRALKSVNKDMDVELDVESLEAVDEDNDSKNSKQMTMSYAIFYYVAWTLVYMDGVDAVPYFILHLLEMAGMLTLYLLNSNLGSRGMAGQVVCAGFMVVYCVVTPLWLYWRSHASFLHPKFRKPSAMQLKVMELLAENPIPKETAPVDDVPNFVEPERVNREKSDAEPSLSKSAVSKRDESSSESESEEEEVPQTITIIQQVAPPPKSMATMATQYDYTAPDVEEIATNTMTEKQNCRACTTTAQPENDGCSVM